MRSRSDSASAKKRILSLRRIAWAAAFTIVYWLSAPVWAAQPPDEGAASAMDDGPAEADAASSDVLHLDRPVSGEPAPEFAALDKAILEFMELDRATAGVVAVSYNGRLLFSHGYGWTDKERTKPTPPDAMLRVASVSKPITAAAVKQLMREDKFTSETKVFEYLGLEPPEGAKVDPRLWDITIGELLRHRGGWDRKKSFDPAFAMQRVQDGLGLDHPPRAIDIVRYMMGQPLQFDPGERSAYSNFGYIALGRVIEKASGKTYDDYLRNDLLKPQGIVDIQVGRDEAKDRAPRDVWYPAEKLRVEVMDACGGLIASAPALCKFMDRFWISGEPRRPGQRGQHWLFFGSIPGTTAMVNQRSDGYNVAAIFNARRPGFFNDENPGVKPRVDSALAEILPALASLRPETPVTQTSPSAARRETEGQAIR